MFRGHLPDDEVICESSVFVLTARLRMDTVDNAITRPVQRLEVFTGTGRRRSFSDEDKARIVAEIVTSGESVSGVARRHGLSPQQLFGWRRQLRESQAEPSDAARGAVGAAYQDMISAFPADRADQPFGVGVLPG